MFLFLYASLHPFSNEDEFYKEQKISIFSARCSLMSTKYSPYPPQSLIAWGIQLDKKWNFFLTSPHISNFKAAQTCTSVLSDRYRTTSKLPRNSPALCGKKMETVVSHSVHMENLFCSLLAEHQYSWRNGIVVCAT